jgi:methylmalonyl-CoA/ethylmalonyl-CoA epimerase
MEIMPGAYTFHHLGVAVSDLEHASSFYSEAFGFRVVSGPFEDPVQKVRACFLSDGGQTSGQLELICPLAGDSPVAGYLAKEIGAYHVCYEVAGVANALAELRARGCLVVARPTPAVAFGGRKIAWCFTPTHQLVELLEKNAPEASNLAARNS